MHAQLIPMLWTEIRSGLKLYFQTHKKVDMVTGSLLSTVDPASTCNKENKSTPDILLIAICASTNVIMHTPVQIITAHILCSVNQC